MVVSRFLQPVAPYYDTLTPRTLVDDHASILDLTARNDWVVQVQHPRLTSSFPRNFGPAFARLVVLLVAANITVNNRQRYFHVTSQSRHSRRYEKEQDISTSILRDWRYICLPRPDPSKETNS